MNINDLARQHRAALAAQSEFYRTHDRTEAAGPDDTDKEATA